jgi:type II secretory pathway component GspD/PulD (secretin)
MKRKGAFAILICFTLAWAAGCTATAHSPHRRIAQAKSDVIRTEYAFNGDLDEYARLVRHLFRIRAIPVRASRMLILQGPPHAVTPAAEMIRKFENTPASPDPDLPATFVRHLNHARAADLAAVLDETIQKGFFVSVAVVAYPPTNSLWVRTTVAEEDRMRNLIDELDRPLAPLTQPTLEIRIEKGVQAPSTRP